MHSGASSLPAEVRRGILAQIQSQIGECEYQRLVATFGEDGLIDQVVTASQTSQVQRPERQVPTLGDKELRFASVVGGSLFGLALGGLFALWAWLLRAVFGVPYWHSAASLFYAMPLVLCLGILRAFMQADKKTDFRSHLFLLAIIGLVGGLIGACRWGCGSQGSITAVVTNHADGICGVLFLIGLVLCLFSLGKVDPSSFAALLMAVIFGVVAIVLVLVDASQDPAGVSWLFNLFVIEKLVGSACLFGLLLGVCFPIRSS